MAATNSSTLYTASEEEEEDDVVDFFAAAFPVAESSLGRERGDKSSKQTGSALVILEGDRAGDEDLPIMSDDMPTGDNPAHPIPRMQAAFEESIKEAAEQTSIRRDVPKDAKKRHLRMLDEEDYNSSYNLLFRKERKSKHHPLWKLMAQIAFGVHLLHKQLAKSDDEVIRILQTHVDEVDGWVETTKEDLDISIADIRERVLHLKTPLEHVNLFDSMLEDPDFRSSIVDGNRRIERMVTRTSVALKDNTTDIHQGSAATVELAKYLGKLVRTDLHKDSDIAPTLKAMRGNADGWLECFRKLQGKANTLGLALQQLRGILTEMSKRAVLASRKNTMVRSISANNSPLDTPPRTLSPPPVSRYAQSNKSSTTLTSMASRINANKPLPPPPAGADQEDTNSMALTRNSALVGQEYPYPPRRYNEQVVLRRPRTTEDLGMRTETSLWDTPDDEHASRRGFSRHLRPRRNSGGKPSAESRSRDREDRSRSRAEDRSRSRTGLAAEALSSHPPDSLVMKPDAQSNLRAKWTAKLKDKGSSLSLTLQKSTHNRSDSLHKSLTRTWSLRSPKPAEIVDTAPSIGGNSNHSRKGSLSSSLRRHRTFADRTRGPWASTASDSAYASRRSLDSRMSENSPTKFQKTPSSQTSLENGPVDSRAQSPIPLKPLPSIMGGDSPADSRRTSQVMALVPQSVNLSPVPPSTRSPTPKSSRPTMSLGKSSLNDGTMYPDDDLREKEMANGHGFGNAHLKEIEPWPTTDYRRSQSEPASRLAGELPPQMTSPNAKKKLRMLKSIFKWRIERVHRTDGRPGSRLEVVRG